MLKTAPPAEIIRDRDPAAGETVVAESVSFERFLTDYSEGHYEWLMGKVIRVVTNNVNHNVLLGWLYNLLSLFLSLKGLGVVFLAGVPMKISSTRPGREPDLMVVLKANAHRIRTTYIDGPADFVVEIVSPDSIERDRATKLEEYQAAGIPEYFLIDPRHRESILYKLGEDGVYYPTPLDSQGRLASTVLPGFALDPALLWREEPLGAEELIALVRAMAGTSL
jgi:Uma2 family endonuclease